MPTEESKICASSPRASTKTFLTLSSVRSSGAGNEFESAAAEAGNLVRLVVEDDVSGGTVTISCILLLSRGLSTTTIGVRIIEIGKALQERIDGILLDIVVWL
jgi:hypothetical protein